MAGPLAISDDQFVTALDEADGLDHRVLREIAGAGQSRSYYVRHRGRILPLKAVLRLAYRRAGVEWDNRNSRDAAAVLRSRFDILHITAQDEEQRLQRQRDSVERWSRPGQAAFRVALLDLYDSKCIVSACDVLDAVDAAHVEGVADEGEDALTNGLILRADLHRLFDAYLMSIDPRTGAVHFADKCRADYDELAGVIVTLPVGGPALRDFAPHYRNFEAKSERK